MKYFIGGVARAYLYSGTEMVMSSNTLINSSIEISTDSVDARGGEGNKLLGKYFHTGTLSITFEDQVFNLDYIARNVGAAKTFGANVFVNEQVTLAAGGTGSLGTDSSTPQPFITGSSAVGWVHPVDDAESIETVTFVGSPAKNFTVSGGTAGEQVCIMYPVESLSAEYIEIPANIIPDTMRCVLVAKLYRASGEAVDLSSSSVVGTVQIDIPRLQFSGAQTISMSSTGVSTTPLTGNALAVDSPDCEGSGTYATFTVNLSGTNWYDKVIALATDDGDITVDPAGTKQIVTYAIAPGTTPFQVATGLTYVSSDDTKATVSNTGLVTGVASGDCYITISITAKTDVLCTIKVTVSA